MTHHLAFPLNHLIVIIGHSAVGLRQLKPYGGVIPVAKTTFDKRVFMRRSLFFLLLVFSMTAVAQPVDSLRHIIDISLERMEKYSIHRSEIDWKKFRQDVYKETKGINNRDSLIEKYPLFFKWLNDYHGGIATQTRWIKWREGRPSRPVNVMMDSALNRGPYLRVARWDDIGYFRVPSVGGLADEVPKRTQRLVDTLCKIQPGSVKGWIIDLRMNTGGNVWPMLATLASLIGDGRIGGLKYIDGSPDDTTFIKNGRPFGNNQFYSIPSVNCPMPESTRPVVVLTGPMTGSSGETLLLAFKGRPNTIIIGETTAGYVTSNNNFELAPNLQLFLATGYMQDRTGRHYTDGIEPDVVIKDGDNMYELDKDEKVRAGLAWLKKQLTGSR